MKNVDFSLVFVPLYTLLMGPKYSRIVVNFQNIAKIIIVEWISKKKKKKKKNKKKK